VGDLPAARGRASNQVVDHADVVAVDEDVLPLDALHDLGQAPKRTDIGVGVVEGVDGTWKLTSSWSSGRAVSKSPAMHTGKNSSATALASVWDMWSLLSS
jgi:hypothetical protein